MAWDVVQWALALLAPFALAGVTWLLGRLRALEDRVVALEKQAAVHEAETRGELRQLSAGLKAMQKTIEEGFARLAAGFDSRVEKHELECRASGDE